MQIAPLAGYDVIQDGGFRYFFTFFQSNFDFYWQN